MFLSCLIAALLYAPPGLIFEDSGLLDLSITLLFAFVIALILATTMARFLRHQVPDTPEDLA